MNRGITIKKKISSIGYVNKIRDNILSVRRKSLEPLYKSLKSADCVVCGGSGSFLLQNAKGVGADIYITGDFKYHEFFDAENDIIIADIGHYESEVYTKELFSELLSSEFDDTGFFLSEISTNPIVYFK